MAFFGHNYDKDDDLSMNDYRVKRDAEFTPLDPTEGMINRNEVKLKMVSLLMDVLKCRKDHATTLVDNHLKKSQLKKKK
jgi:hypothetical protein